MALRWVALALLGVGAWSRFGPFVGSLLVSGGLLVALGTGFVRRGRIPPGARADAPAWLLDDEGMWSGQLALLPESLYWSPSRFSARRGHRTSDMSLAGEYAVTCTTAGALLDCRVTIGAGAPITFVVRRASRLIKHLRNHAG